MERDWTPVFPAEEYRNAGIEGVPTPRDLPSVTQWACQCCTLMMANGECGEDCHETEPLSDIPNGAHVTLGMDYEEHDASCLRNSDPDNVPSDYECDCERYEFSWRSCDACGSNLGGSRHAFVIWTPATDTVA